MSTDIQIEASTAEHTNHVSDAWHVQTQCPSVLYHSVIILHFRFILAKVGAQCFRPAPPPLITNGLTH